MAPAPNSTIIITGGTGSLGSSLARALETTYPGRFHLLLTCRNPDDEHAKAISSFLALKKASFELQRLDLSDLGEVGKFVEDLKTRIGSGDLPRLVGGGVVNSAACQTFYHGRKAKGGMDVMYTVNCLAPALLMRGLVDVMASGEGSAFVNVGSGAYEIGRCDYFEDRGKEGKEGEKLGFLDGMKRYGSCKLVTMMLGFAFQRRLYTVSFSPFPAIEARNDPYRGILRTNCMSLILILAR
jgi:NAD(P)-dependent dehydrogenase (short-subunit alcohol dehydrogenase family)